MMAKMKRGSTPDELATLLMAVFMLAISSVESLGTFQLAQDCCMMGTLKFHKVSKSSHLLWAGQPAPTVPSPVYIWYAYELVDAGATGEVADGDVLTEDAEYPAAAEVEAL